MNQKDQELKKVGYNPNHNTALKRSQINKVVENVCKQFNGNNLNKKEINDFRA